MGETRSEGWRSVAPVRVGFQVMCALLTEPAGEEAPVVGVSTPFLPSLKHSPSPIVTAARLRLQVKDQGSASDVEEPAVWLFPHKGERQASCSQHPGSL